MNLLYLISQILKRKTFKAEHKETDFIIISPIDQILNRLKSISKSKNIKDYERIISEMMSNLKYDEIELLIHKSFDLKNRDVFLAALEKKKYNWRAEIENDFLKNNEDAKLSLSTSDYLAYIIGRKYDLHILSHSTNFWKEYYKALENDLNLLLIQNKLLASLEADNKVHVPINYALSMFLLYDKNIALPKFKRILNNDKTSRLDTNYQAEYFITVGNFFDRIKLNFIPKIDFKNEFYPIKLENEDNEYITRDEVQIIIDKEDFFNKRPFKIGIEYLLNSRNISKKNEFDECFHLFFNLVDPSFKKLYIQILISCMTKVNPPFSDYEISNAQFHINNFINHHQMKDELIKLLYFLDIYFVTYKSINRLSVLIPEFFNKVDGIGADTIKNIYRIKKDVNFKNKIHNKIITILESQITQY